MTLSLNKKINDARRTFNNDWAELFIFVEHRGKLLCLICNKTITLLKKYNVRRHYKTERITKFENLTDELRENTL